MNNWPYIELDSVCNNITVGFVGTMALEYVDEGILFLRSQNILPFRLNLEPNQVKYISKDFNKKISKSKLYPGDIAIVRTGYPGTACVIPESFEEVNCSDLVIVRPHKLKVNSTYLCYYINSPVGKGAIFGSLVGAAQQHFNVAVAKKMKLRLPPLPIQSKIASILSAYDELIENNKQRIKVLEEMAEEIYKEWFVRLRFPGYETTKLVNGLPEGWEWVKLRECFTHYIGGGWGYELPEGKNSEPAYVIRGTDIPNARTGNLNFEVLRYHSISNLSSRKLQANDIVFEVSGGTESQSLGRTLFISQLIINRFDQDLICASFCKLIRINQDLISALIIYLLLNRLYGTGEIMLYQVQSTGISNYKFEDFIDNQKVQVPSKEIQQEFDRIIQPMFDEVQILGAKNQLLQQTRDLLLPRLISGKLSVEHLVEEEDAGLLMAAEPGVVYQAKK